MGELLLGLAAERGADEAGAFGLGEAVDDECAVGAVVERDLDAELIGNAERREDVIGAVGMGLERDLAVDHGQHRLHLEVEGTRFALLFGGGDVLLVLSHLVGRLAQKPGDGHAGDRRLASVLPVAALGIFAEGDLHGDRALEDHGVDVVADELDRGEGAADDVRGAGAGNGRGDARRKGDGNRLVIGPEAVNGAHVGRDGVGALVDVGALPAGGFAMEAEVAVGLDEAGGDDEAVRVDDAAVGRRFDLFADCGDFAAFDEDVAFGNVLSGNGLDVSALNEKCHGCCPFPTIVP